MADKPKVAVVLSGCGVYDGAEIHEAVLTLLALDRQGAEYACFAPNVPQAHVINHLTGQPAEGESRNVLVESARIARGAIRDLAEYRAADFDALVFPGGFGAAKNLSTFAFAGADMEVDAEVERAVRDTRAADKPIGALCIAPTILARLLAPVQVTIGGDAGVAAAIEAMGSHHVVTGHGGVVVDASTRVATTPCYMLDATISQIEAGASAVVAAVLAMVRGETPAGTATAA